MVDHHLVSQITSYCVSNLDLKNADLGHEYYYSSMPLCVVDSVFSIGVKYEGVINTIQRLCNYINMPVQAKQKYVVPAPDEQISTTEFLKLLSDMTPELLAKEVYGNKQRTSTSNGILKAEAVSRFLSVLKDFRAEYFHDIPKLINNCSFKFCITNIPGQKSGLSLKYFFMLAGTDDFVKPDRMIMRFLTAATGKKHTADEAQLLLYTVAGELNKQGYSITPKLLDHTIWKFQRDQD